MLSQTFMAQIGLAALALANVCTAQMGPPGWQGTGVYAIYNVGTNTAVDLVNGNPNNGAPIAGYPNNWAGNQHQLWFTVPIRIEGQLNNVIFFNNATDSVITAMSGQAPVTARTDLTTGDYRTVWNREAVPDVPGAYRFRNFRWPGQLLDMDHSNPAPGTPVNCWPRNSPDTPNQQWYMQLMGWS